MRTSGAWKHILIVLAGVLLLLGLPLWLTGSVQAWRSGSTDAVSAATVIIAQPSGEYVVLINREMHTDQENLKTWIQFFSGEEISYLFEDISCSVISGDSGALTMARSFQSRLPEKQMSVQTENATLLMSRADQGKFDVIILSKEFAENYQASTVDGTSTEWILVTGGTN